MKSSLIYVLATATTFALALPVELQEERRSADMIYVPLLDSRSPGSTSQPSAADRKKYDDNLAKQAAGNCGQGCRDSIASFQSQNSKANKNNIVDTLDNDVADNEDEKLEAYQRSQTSSQTQAEQAAAQAKADQDEAKAKAQQDAADRQKYQDNLAKLAAGNCGQGCKNSIASYQSKHPGSSQAKNVVGRRANTAADKAKNDQNLAKQQAGNCGKGCQNSIASFNSQASKDSAASKASKANPKKPN